MPELIQDKRVQMLQREQRVRENLGRMKRVIGVHSGKGGVGKTTVAVNIAALLARRHQVGLLDADIDCPNVGTALGISQQFATEGSKLLPVEKYGMKIASTAFLFGAEEQSIMFRGPIKHHALMQLLEVVDFGALDYLIIDEPPGTSDVPLSTMQFIRPHGMIIVTAPQPVAVADAKRSIRMAMNLNIPVLGVAENMSGDTFGSGGGEQLAREMGVPFLGRIPLDARIREFSDKGKVPALEDAGIGKMFEDIAAAAGL